MTNRALTFCLSVALPVMTLTASAQTADEHTSHHPSGSAPIAQGMVPGPPVGATVTPFVTTGIPGMAAPSVPGTTGVAGTPGAPPGMTGMMSGMMPPAAGCMGGNCGSGAAKTPIYSSLMTLPALTPEKRSEIDALASEQINEGMGRLATGSDALERAAQVNDYAAMQQSIGLMREGLDVLGAGISARRVLVEGKAPRNLALDWFKREMNLSSPIAVEETRALLGDTAFHLITMGLLIAFAVAMVAMYFFKMRRAAALFKRIAPDSGAPPPGASPPLAGVPSPPSPASLAFGGIPPTLGQPSQAGNTSPIEGTPKPSSLALPAPGTAPSSDPSPARSSVVLAPKASSESPPTANWRGSLRIGSILTETPSVKTIRLLPAAGETQIPFIFVPGQFLNVAFWIGGARMNRSYSISSSPTQRDHIDLTVRREPRGAVSRHIHDLLKVGDQIEAGGPVGRFTFSGKESDSIVLIAGGVGITPMMSITRYLTDRSWAGDIFFVYACRAPTDFIFADDVAALERGNSRLHVIVTMSDAEKTPWKGPRGRLTKEFLTRSIPNLASRRVHLCGPPSMMDATKAILIELGVASEQIKTEAFGAVKPAPAPAGTSAKPAVLATGPLVTFSSNNKSAKIRVDQTVLELSEELAIGIQFSCRVGTCGLCKVKMTSGEVAMAVEDALEPADKANGIILACQAKPTSDITVEA